MSAEFSSTSPIDESVVWRGTRATSARVESTMSAASQAAALWRKSSPSDREKVVTSFGEYLQKHQAEVAELISREVGKLNWDARAEVNAAIAKAKLSIKACHDRRSTQTTDDRGERVVRFRPLGVILVLGPFNFPLHLPGGQIIPALLAGNSVVLKPSDQAPAVGEWLQNAWQSAGLPDGVFQVLQGDVETAVAAIDSPHVDGVFLTGSRAAGKAIHRQLAGRPEVLLALELGGNNPIVITDADVDQSASIVSFSAFISAGQRCTCARRAIFVEDETSEARIQALISKTRALKVGLPGDPTAPQVGPVISNGSARQLRATYQSLVEMGCRPMIPFPFDRPKENLLAPCVLDATGLDARTLDRIGELEWFGPLLLVQRAKDVDEAFDAARRTPYGLAASLLGGTRSTFERFVDQVGAGVVNWNRPTTGAAGTLPFGGLNESGNHRPAGFYAIDACNDPVASLEGESMPQEDPWGIANS